MAARFFCRMWCMLAAAPHVRNRASFGSVSPSNPSEYFAFRVRWGKSFSEGERRSEGGHQSIFPALFKSSVIGPSCQCLVASFFLYTWLSTGFSRQGRAELRAFLRYRFAENTQLSPSLTRKPGIQRCQFYRLKWVYLLERWDLIFVRGLVKFLPALA